MITPEAVHFGQNDLPFIDIGDGSKLKVLQVKSGEGLWIIENIFQSGYEVETYKHTGPCVARSSPVSPPACWRNWNPGCVRLPAV